MSYNSLFVLSFQKDDVLNTVLTTPDNTPLYEITTPISGNVTTVKRIVPGRVPGYTDEFVIGVIHRRALKTDTVEFHGQSVPLKQYLPKAGAFSWYVCYMAL